jgi:hypothetical protein
LNISRFDPPLDRAATQEAEDEFCQRLLLLGAKWFDSQSRIGFTLGLKENDAGSLYDLENGKTPELVLGERQWVKVGWPTQGGGLWVGEWDTTLPGILEDDVVPGDAARVTLALDMDERCDILKGMGAKFYKSFEDYDGNTYLRAWETKWEGEVEPLQQTWANIWILDFLSYNSGEVRYSIIGRSMEGQIACRTCENEQPSIKSGLKAKQITTTKLAITRRIPADGTALIDTNSKP